MPRFGLESMALHLQISVVAVGFSPDKQIESVLLSGFSGKRTALLTPCLFYLNFSSELGSKSFTLFLVLFVKYLA